MGVAMCITLAMYDYVKLMGNPAITSLMYMQKRDMISTILQVGHVPRRLLSLMSKARWIRLDITKVERLLIIGSL